MSLAKYYSLMLSNSRLLRSQSIKQLTAAWSAHKTADLKKVFFSFMISFFGQRIYLSTSIERGRVVD